MVNVDELPKHGKVEGVATVEPGAGVTHVGGGGVN
jgi:hypothetical protein